MKVAFLDRDGTINKDYADEVWSQKTEPEFLEGSLDAMKRLNELGYAIIIVTNQGLINEGYITEAEYEAFHGKLLLEVEKHDVRVLDTFYCPHSDLDRCNCRKPKPGMIEAALEKYADIELNESFMTGDSVVDMGLAKHFGLNAYGIGLDETAIDYVKGVPVSSLLEAVDMIEKERGIS